MGINSEFINSSLMSLSHSKVLGKYYFKELKIYLSLFRLKEELEKISENSEIDYSKEIRELEFKIRKYRIGCDKIC